MGRGRVSVGFFAVALCVVFFCGVTASFAAEKVVKPTTSVEKIQTEQVKPDAVKPEAVQHKKMLMKPLKVQCPDPGVKALEFEILSRESDYRGRVRITGTVRNVGAVAYDSGPNQQSVQLWEDVQGVSEKQPVASRAFEDLAPDQEVTVSYVRSWNASSPAEGEFPPSYLLLISYDPDIAMDGNEGNDDCRSTNNRKERSGMEINSMFTE